MSNEIKRFPADWSKDLGIEIIDPDGWREDGASWNRWITEEEFRRRAAMSTMREVATPAPLDPSKVKAGGPFDKGDSARYVGPNLPGFAAVGVQAGRVFSIREGTTVRTGTVLLGGVKGAWPAINFELVARAAAHQPAPEPVPTYQFGDALVDGLSVHGFVTNEGESFVFPLPDGGYHEVGHGAFTDFVPDEPRPLPTRAQVFDVLYPDGIMPNEDMRDSKIDALMALFGGAR